MDSGMFEIISIIAFCLAGVSLGVAVYLFFSNNIIAVVGDLSGKTAQKQIEAIREQNAQSGDKRYRPGLINLGRGKITEKVQTGGMKGSGKTGPSSRLRQAASSKSSVHSNETEVIKVFEDSEVLTENTAVLLNQFSQAPAADATEVLITPADATEVLANDNSQPADATEVLMTQPVDATEVLANDNSQVVTDATEILTSHNEGAPNTDKLSAITDRLSRTELLSDPTEVLSYDTEILPKETAAESDEQEDQAKTFIITEKTMLVHTDEAIE